MDPYLDKGMRGWIVKTSRQNLWRVAGWYCLDDLIQDGYLCFYKCRARYKKFNCAKPTADQKKQFMALVQRSFTNHIHSLSKHRQQELPVDSIEECAGWARIAELQEGPLRALLARAPQELVDVIVLLTSDGSGYLRRRVRRRLIRETTNARIARLLNRPEEDFVGLLCKYVTP